MVNVSQVQRGFVNFIDNEIAVAFDGWQQAVLAGAAALLAAGMPNLIKTYGSNPVVAALNIYDAKANAVNIDAIYNAFVPKLGAEKIPVVIPKIGTIKLGREEIDSLMQYIKEG